MISSILATAAIGVFVTASAFGPSPQRDPGPAASSAAGSYGGLPLAFEANAGQTDASVRFLARGAGYTVFLTDREAVLALAPERKGGPVAVVRMVPVGGDPQATMRGTDRQRAMVNYLRGDDPTGWFTGIPTFGRVRADDVYPGIDLVYYGHGRQLEYDFVVAAGADPSAIRVAFEGADRLSVRSNGDLVLQVGRRRLVQRAPVIYQEDAGKRHVITGRYAVDGDEVAIALGAYDRGLPLVIDPVLDYSTYLGGSSSEAAYGITVDPAGNAYVAGQTTSVDFPVTSGAAQTSFGSGDFDAFVAKLNAAGTDLVYATYLGGSGFDYAEDVAIDSAGSAYVTGVTTSTNFPRVGAFQTLFGGIEDAFVAKLNPQGSVLTYSSYLGGAGDDGGYSIAVDGSGRAYLTGFTDSVAFPRVNAIQTTKGGTLDAFVSKVNAAGSALLYSTYLGGDIDDLGYGIAVDAAGAAYVTGETLSSDFPTASPIQASTGGAFDAFVTKLNAAGSALTYSTYLGGGSTDGARDIALDGTGNAYVTGLTESTNFPTTTGAWDRTRGGLEDAFVTKLNAAGSARVYSTYLGGSTADFGLSGLDEGYGIAVDAAGAAHVTGLTQSNDFPLVDAIQSTMGSFQDAFVARLSPAGSALQHSSYLGGSGEDEGLAAAVDGSGGAYFTGLTDSTDYPTTAGAFQEDQPSQFLSSAFVTRLRYPAPSDTTPPTVTAPVNDFRTGVAVGTSSTPVPVRISWTAADPGGVASTELQRSLNGSSFTPVTLPNATATSVDLSFATSTLAVHAFRDRATDVAGNTSAFASGAGFKVKVFQDGSSSLVYTGTWSVQSATTLYGGSARYSAAAGRKVALTTAGTDFAIVSTKAPNRGKVRMVVREGTTVLVDRVVDLYAASTRNRQVVFAASFPASATRTIELTVTGTKRAASSGKRGVLDAFLVMAP
jgi:hypothetical protein